MKKNRKNSVSKSKSENTLWTNSTVQDRANALPYKFSKKTLQAVAKSHIKISREEEERKYKKSFSKDVLNKVMR